MELICLLADDAPDVALALRCTSEEHELLLGTAMGAARQ
jgi:hypothetical protein